MNQRSISFVIPSYNSAETIGECLDSVLLSAIDGDEVVICDNCSIDLTIQICKMKLKKCNLSYKIIVNASNFGPVRNWLIGISNSKHDWVKLIFSDDIILNQDFNRARSVFIPDNCDGLFSPALIKTSDSLRMAYKINQPTGILSSSLFLKEILHWRLPFSPTAMFFKRSYAIHVLHSQILLCSDATLSNGAGPDYSLYLSAGLRGRLFYYDKAIACMNESKQSITFNLGSEALRNQYISAAINYLTISCFHDEKKYLIFKELLRKYMLKKCYHMLFWNILKSPMTSFKIFFYKMQIRG